MSRELRPEWFAVVDTAQNPRLSGLVKRSADWQCLVTGNPPPVLAATLPYIVQLRSREPLALQWRAEGIGLNWGIKLLSSLTLDDLRIHFKKFLTVRLPDGTAAQFRFYDPRVFRAFIRTCSSEQLEPWFRGIDCYVVDGMTFGSSATFRFVDGRLLEAPAAWSVASAAP
jgi:hypothetical protein